MFLPKSLRSLYANCIDVADVSVDVLNRYFVEWQDYTGKWNRLFYVDHVDLAGAADFAARRLHEVSRAGAIIPKAAVLRVRDESADITACVVAA